MNLEIFTENYPLFFEGLWVTFYMVSLSLFFGFCLSVPLAFAKLSRFRVIRFPVDTFSFFFRGTPLLLQIYMIYYGSGQFEWIRESFLWNFLEDAYFCALLALTLNTTAYTTQIFYGGLSTVTAKEIRAGKAFGMTPWQIGVHIMFPNAMRRVLPPYGNEVVFMFQSSAVVSVITLMDLTGAARYLYSKYYDPFTPFLIAGAFYLILIYFVLAILKLFEKKYLAHLTSRRPVSNTRNR